MSRDVVLDREVGDVDGGDDGEMVDVGVGEVGEEVRLSARRRRSLNAIFGLILFVAGFRDLVEKVWLCA